MKNGVVWGGKQEHIIHKHQPAMNTQDNRPTKHPDADDRADAKQRQDSDRGVSIPDGSDDETQFCPIQPEYPKYPGPSIPFETPEIHPGTLPISPGIYGDPFSGTNAPLHAPKAKLRRAVVILSVLLICGSIAGGELYGRETPSLSRRRRHRHPPRQKWVLSSLRRPQRGRKPR